MGLAIAGVLVGLASQGQDIKSGLKAYLNFDQKNYEDAVGIFDGTPNGDSPIEFVSSKAGFGQAIQLLGPSDSGGANQFVEISGGEPDDLAFADGSMSVSIWFTVEAWDKQWQALAAKGENNNWRIHRRGGENVMGFTGGAGGDTPSGTKEVNDGQWHHLVAISDTTTLTSSLYIDGELDSTREIGALTANGQRMMIGENPDARNRYWHGLVDDVAVWDRALTESEVKSLWNNGAGKPLSAFFAPPNDSDNDGMPNDWETQYGFNPNDPSDAALDFDGDGVSNLDEYKAGTNPSDVTKPTIVSAATSASFNTITLTFSEDLDPATATVTANYTLTPNLAVTAATYRNKVVTLTTANQTPGGTAYTVAVKGVRDTSKNEVAAGTQVVVFSYVTTRNGVLKISVWENIPSTPVQNLYDDPRYPASPDRVGAVFSFNSRDYLPTDNLENYGATIEGYLTPTESGQYRFFIYSDDASELYLSTDDKEANLELVAEETGCCNNFTEPDSPRTSEPKSLVAGRKYFIRLVYKEGGGGDYGQVAWRREGDPTPAGTLRPISGLFLSSATDLPAPADGVFITQSPAANAKGVAPNSVVTIVHADGKTPWTAGNVSLTFDGAAVSPTFTAAGGFATIVYDPPGLLAARSVHTVTLTYPNPAGQPTTREWSFEVADYPTLTTAQQAVSFDATKPGFTWSVFQNESFTHTTLKQTEDALAGRLMNGTTPVTDNLADPAARGPALANGVKVGNLVKFEIATVINLSQTEAENNGNFPNDAQMPGIPGLNGANDGIDAEIIAFVELPAGPITMGVNSDDGFRSQVGYINVPADGLLLGQFDGGRGAADTLFTFVVETPGVYPIRTIYQEGGGGANIEIFSVKADGTKVLLNDTANGGYKTYRAGVAPNKPNNPLIGIVRAGAGATITYTGTLQSADNPAGPYTDVAGATSPFTVTTGSAQKYYRTRN